MSAAQKEFISRWIPIVIALLGNAMVVGIFYGQTKESISSLQAAHTEIKSTIMPRLEIVAELKGKDREMADIKEGLKSANQKLDKLINELPFRRLGTPTNSRPSE